MTKIDKNKILQLIKDGKKEELKKIFKEVFDADLSQEERGAYLTSIALAFTKINNELKKEYLKELEKTVHSMKTIDDKVTQVEEDVKMVLTKAKIAQEDDL